MRTDELIVALAADLRPVAVLPRPGLRLRQWTTVAAGAAATAIAVFGVRDDVQEAWRTSSFGLELLLVTAAAAAAAAATMLSGVPGAPGARPARLIALTAGVAWAAAVFWRLAAETGAPVSALIAEPSHVACPLRMLFAGLLPGVVALVMVRRAAPLQPAWSAALAALAAGAASAAAVQIICPIAAATHVFIWHVLPVFVGVALAAVAGARPAVRRPHAR